MVDRLIDSLAKGTDREKGDPETASACSKAWGLISRQSNDPTLGEVALNQKDAFTNFEKMQTSRLIEVTDAHSRVVDQIQVTLEGVRLRQTTLPKEAPKVLHEALASFANALEQRLEHAAGPLADAREELSNRRNKALENATVFESRFGKPLTDLVKTHAGEVFKEIPNVSQEKVVAASLTAKDSPGFAILEKTSRGLLDRVVAHIGNASQSDAITGMSQSDLLKLTNSELDSLLDRSSGLSANLKNDQAIIEEVLETLATPGDTGPVAKNKSDEFLGLLPGRGKRRLAESNRCPRASPAIGVQNRRRTRLDHVLGADAESAQGNERISAPGNHVIHFALPCRSVRQQSAGGIKPNSPRGASQCRLGRLSNSKCLCDRAAKSRSVLPGHRNRAGHNPTSRVPGISGIQQDGRQGRKRVEGCL